jgi:hypothetical protein
MLDPDPNLDSMNLDTQHCVESTGTITKLAHIYCRGSNITFHHAKKLGGCGSGLSCEDADPCPYMRIRIPDPKHLDKPINAGGPPAWLHTPSRLMMLSC